MIKKLIEYLTTYFSQEGLFVGMEAPSELSGYVLIDQTASSTTNRITTTTVAVQSYGKSLVDALDLNESVKAAMFSFAGENEIASVRLETDYNFTNTATKQYRWQAVYQITHYLGGN